MNKVTFAIVLVGYSISNSVAQSTSSTVAADYQALVAAEQSFAAYTEKEGIKAGFSRFLSPEGIVVVKDDFTLGKPLYEKAPYVPGVLSWTPVYADIADSGDFGYTTGPFEVRPKMKTDDPVGFGHFTTVWQKNRTGQWEAIADVGITHTNPQQVRTDLYWPDVYSQRWRGDCDTTARRIELIEAENRLAQLAGGQSLRSAYQSALAKNHPVRLYRKGFVPVMGDEARTYIDGLTTTAIYRLSRVKVASSGDMGIAYGYVQEQDRKGLYLRIWKRLPDMSWKLVHEVLDI